MKHIHGLVIFIFLGILSASAQTEQVLPEFSVRELTKGKIQVSWNNPYQNCVQLAVQRSGDSVNNFRTIFSTQSPELPSNGFLDNKPILGIKSYYRVFYVLLGGAYYFSKPIGIEAKMTNPVMNTQVLRLDPKNIRTKGKIFTEGAAIDMVSIYIKKEEVFKLTPDEYKLFRDSVNTRTKDALVRIDEYAVEWRPAKTAQKKNLYSIYLKNRLLAEFTESGYKKFKDSIAGNTKHSLYAIDPWRIQLQLFEPKPIEYMFIYKNDSLVAKLEMPLYRKFKDSLATTTKDTLFSINTHQFEIHPFMAKYVWRPSQYVFTNTKGYVTIILPQVKQHRYRIIFYDDDATELFQIRSLKEVQLVLDKTNFIHAGWFSFELFENDKLKEKNKFYLAKD